MSFAFGSNFTSLTYSQANEFNLAWRKYLEVQSYNSNVSTIWSSGNKTAAPYKFSGQQERHLFIQGQALYQQAYPGANVNLIRPQ